MEERIRAIYNDCWMSYKKYIKDHNMREYNERSDKLMEKYGRENDISGLLFWFAGPVQSMHDQYLGVNHGGMKKWQ